MADSTGLVDRVVERACRDEQFRTRLMANPKAAVESELGFSIPRELTVRVVEERPNEFYIVLPPV